MRRYMLIFDQLLAAKEISMLHFEPLVKCQESLRSIYKLKPTLLEILHKSVYLM